MAKRVTITETEILDALAVTNDSPKEAKTVAEIAAETGIQELQVRKALHRYKHMNRLGVHRVIRIALDDRQAVVNGYTILATAKRAS